MDYAKELILLLFDATGGPLPPYLLEIIMQDGRSFYVHSAGDRDEETDSVVLLVYDFRAIGPQAEMDIQAKLDQPGAWKPSTRVEDLHPLLSSGRLRCKLSDIAYCVEWLTRRWTLVDFVEVEKEKARKLGFKLPGTAE